MCFIFQSDELQGRETRGLGHICGFPPRVIIVHLNGIITINYLCSTTALDSLKDSFQIFWFCT